MKARSNKPLADQIAQLYRGELAEFTSRRNALAGRLEARGDRDAEQRIKRLPKPKLSAWVVNRLYASSRKTFDRLLAAGADLRELQRTHSGSPEQLREVMERRRKLIETLSARGAAFLEGAGQAATRTTLRRIETNLDALAIHEPKVSAELLGRLATDLAAPGFDAFLGAPAPAAARARVQRLERDRETLHRAEHEQERRRFAAQSAIAERKAARQSLEQSTTREGELKLRLRQAARATRRAQTVLKRAEAAVERTRRAQAQATKRVKAAKRKLEER